MKTLELVKIEPYGFDDKILTVRVVTRPNFLMRLLGAKDSSYTRKFCGSCTVWFKYPEGDRMSTGWEIALSNLERRNRFMRREFNK